MVDACDSDRLPEVEEELAGLVKDQSLEGVPIAVLFNKTDVS